MRWRALYARETNPVISLRAEEGIAAIARALPEQKSNATGIRARSDAFYGAWLCGVCLRSGGMFDLSHAQLHAAVLPHVVAYNQAAAPRATTKINQVIGFTDAPWPLRSGQGTGRDYGAARSRDERGGCRPRSGSGALQPLLEPAAARLQTRLIHHVTIAAM
ncbi:iron-containing alcohol dehydrogenase [Ochrobactrum sp. BD22]|nr:MULTISPECIES: iron-containing alcohol dehydrogenase [unclassified Ochrobactrum]